MDWRQEAVALINAELNDGFVGTVLRFRDAIRRQDAKETAALAETILQILAAHSESVVHVAGVTLLTCALAGDLEGWQVEGFTQLVSIKPTAWGRRALAVLQRAVNESPQGRPRGRR